jgi:hypothetical protein
MSTQFYGNNHGKISHVTWKIPLLVSILLSDRCVEWVVPVLFTSLKDARVRDDFPTDFFNPDFTE